MNNGPEPSKEVLPLRSVVLGANARQRLPGLPAQNGRTPEEAALTADEPALSRGGAGGGHEWDLFWEAKWKSLGQAVHYEYHRAVGSTGRTELPDPRTSSFITVGRGVSEYPPPAWVDAIDRNAGRADWQIGEFVRLSTALDWLRVFDPIAADLVVTVCVRGRSSIVFGRGVRHWSLADIAELEPFADDFRKAQDWLLKSWELLGILLATPANLRKAMEANAVERWALSWCRERGLVE